MTGCCTCPAQRVIAGITCVTSAYLHFIGLVVIQDLECGILRRATTQSRQARSRLGFTSQVLRLNKRLLGTYRSDSEADKICIFTGECAHVLVVRAVRVTANLRISNALSK